MKLKDAVDEYMKRVPQVKEYCDRCLNTERWYGNIVLMIVDSAFTSVGLNYFHTVVPKVEIFRKSFIENGKIKKIEDFLSIDKKDLFKIWKNKRSWRMAREITSYLSELKKEKKMTDREVFIYWAKNAETENWKEDPIGKINGVGINTFQYLRMMGGVDTVMPDKVVKKIINEILSKTKLKTVSSDMEFIHLMNDLSKETGYKAIELCWMTWLQSETDTSKIEKHSKNLPRVI
jgi:hypothetical protein